jgi:predicted amidophosphoribosyltransferase
MPNVVCPNCGVELGGWGFHLCRNASFAQPRKCVYCGKTVTDPRHICKAMLPHLQYTCVDCGRVAVEDQHLCNPVPIA